MGEASGEGRRELEPIGGVGFRAGATSAQEHALLEENARPAHLAPMSRTPLALLLSLVGLFLYVCAAVSLADEVIGTHWVFEALYYLVAGVAWAVPARWLMGWAARGAARES